mgnify:FL=1
MSSFQFSLDDVVGFVAMVACSAVVWGWASLI